MYRGPLPTHTWVDKQACFCFLLSPSAGIFCRLLSSNAQEPREVFVVGFEPALGDEVAAALYSVAPDAVINYPVPEAHWLVSARRSDLIKLQETFPSVTVVSDFSS